MVAALVSIEHGIKGHISAPNASSAGSAAAIGEAYRLIRDGYMDGQFSQIQKKKNDDENYQKELKILKEK